MNGPLRRLQSSPFHGGFMSLQSPRLRFFAIILLVTAISVLFAIFSISRILSNTSGTGGEVVVPPAEFERLNDIYSKPLILPNENSPDQTNTTDTRVDVNLESTSDDSTMSGTMTVNGQTVPLNSATSNRETITTRENDGSTAVDISISSDSTGSESSQFDLQMNSESEVYIDSEW